MRLIKSLVTPTYSVPFGLLKNIDKALFLLYMFHFVCLMRLWFNFVWGLLYFFGLLRAKAFKMTGIVLLLATFW